MILTAKTDQGIIVNIPDEILIIEKYMYIPENTHFKLTSNDSKYNMVHTFRIVSRNGKAESGYFLAESFLKIKYVACSTEKYLGMKVFL